MPSPTRSSRACCRWRLFPFWALLGGQRLKQSRCSWTHLCSSAENTAGGRPWLLACEMGMLPPICEQMSERGERYKQPERADPPGERVGACCTPPPAISSSGSSLHSNSPCSPASNSLLGIGQLTINSFRCLALRGQTHTRTTQNQSKILIRTFPRQPIKSRLRGPFELTDFPLPPVTLRRTFADRNHYSHSQGKLLSSSPTPIINISQ